MLTNRTMAVFNTAAFRVGEVYDETFHAHARAILEALRAKLIVPGRNASAVEDHSHYGMAFTIEDPASGRVYVLLQVVGPWLLTLTRELKFFARIRGAREEDVDEAFVREVDAALVQAGAESARWYTPAEYDQVASKPGTIDPDA